VPAIPPARDWPCPKTTPSPPHPDLTPHNPTYPPHNFPKKQLQKLSNLPALVKISRSYGLPLRITEAATISYGGVQGISDTAGAALWALDAGMEAAYMGVAGIHFHRENPL
jgi:hypothetical protein